MAEQMSFRERFDALLCEAMLRHGIIARRRFGSWDPTTEKYLELGITPTRGPFGMTKVDSLSEAKCPQCGSAMEVRNPREEIIDDWAGTFAESSSYTHGTGDLVCASHPEKHPRYSVVLDGTLAEAVEYIDAIAEELGY